jgi:hypothetical protein
LPRPRFSAFERVQPLVRHRLTAPWVTRERTDGIGDDRANGIITGRMDLHRDAALIAARLAREGVAELYHFTSVENLPQIGALGGLACKDHLDAAGCWPPPQPGGNVLSHSLDERHGNFSRVHLSLTPYTPMAYSKKQEGHLCWIRVSPDVARAQGVVFTDTNATATDHERAEGAAGLDLVDFEAIRSDPRPWDKDGWHRPVQAEVLASERVAFEHMFDVNFVSEASRQEGLRLWGEDPPVPFLVRADLFRDSQHGGLSFPYLSALTLTSSAVDADSAGDTPSDELAFSRARTARISFLANASVLAGTVAHVEWSDGTETDEDFDRSGGFRHWGSVSLEDLPSGWGSLTYRLGQVRWATRPFQVED